MKANEQGLTLEEQIMFAVLGIILVIAIGVLTFNYFSNHERKMEEPNTAEKEMGEDKSVDSKENIVKPVDILKEDSSDNSTIKIEGLPYFIKTNNDISLTKKTNNQKSTSIKKTNTNTKQESTSSDDGIGSTDIGEVDEEAAYIDFSEDLDWTFNSNIVKESYANEIIKVPNTVTLTDGTEKEAEVVIKEKNSGDERFITNGEISLPSGEYIYYYTCNNKTKEIPLTIYNKMDNARIVFASVKDTYSGYSEDLKFITDNSTVTSNENNYKISIKRQKTVNPIPLKVILSNPYNKVERVTNGISVSNDSSITDLNNNEFIIWLDLNTISLTKTNKVLLNIDETEYLFNLNISIENIEEEKEEVEEQPTQPEENNKEENQNQENKQPEEKKESTEVETPTQTTKTEEKNNELPKEERVEEPQEKETKDKESTKVEEKEEQPNSVEEQKPAPEEDNTPNNDATASNNTVSQAT